MLMSACAKAAGLATTIAEDCDAIRMLAIVDTKTAFGSWLTLSKFEYVCISAIWRASDTRAGGYQRADCLVGIHTYSNLGTVVADE